MSSTRRKNERPKPCGSQLLTDEENQQLFEVLGKDRIPLSAGVAQLICSKNEGVWTRLNVGVALLIKDYIKRSYVISLYDVLDGRILWSQPLYKNFQIKCYTNCPRLIVFEGDNCVYGLNFSDYDEAKNFREHLNRRFEQERKSNQREFTRPMGESPPTNINPHMRRLSKDLPNTATTGITTIGTVPHLHSSAINNESGGNNLLYFSKKNKKGKEKKNKPRKEDIGNPIEFRHLVHVGWDQDQGLKPQVFEENPLDDTIKTLLIAAGQNPDEMPNDELKYAYKFIQKKFQQISRPMPMADYSRHEPSAEQISTPFISGQYSGNQNANYGGTDIYSHQRKFPEQGFEYGAQTAKHRYQGGNNQTAPFVGGGSSNGRPPRPPPVTSAPTYRGPLPPTPPEMDRFNSNNGGHFTNGSGIRPTTHNKPLIPNPSIQSNAAPKSNSSNYQTVEQQQFVADEIKSAPVSQNAPPPPPPPPPPGLFASSSIQQHSSNGREKDSTEGHSTTAAGTGISNLLAEIQQGPKLKKVGPPPSDKAPVPTNPPSNRDVMMNEIRQGANLKHVDQSEIGQRASATNIQDLSGMAGALARALEQRRKNLINTDDSSSNEEQEDNSEWEDT